MRSVVVIESPYAGDVVGNVAYARAAVAHSLAQNEAPMASHLLYTQPGVLDDDDPDQRLLGIEAGWEFFRMASAVVFYCDRGMSKGMTMAYARAQNLGVPIIIRYLGHR